VNKNVLVLVSPTFHFPEFVQAKGGNPEDLVSAKTEIPTAIGGVRTNRFRPLHLSRLRRFPRTGRRAGTRQCETEIYPETAAWWHALVWTLYAIEALPSKLNSGLYELADALALAITAMIARISLNRAGPAPNLDTHLRDYLREQSYLGHRGTRRNAISRRLPFPS
jgi:hypothetical protein